MATQCLAQKSVVEARSTSHTRCIVPRPIDKSSASMTSTLSASLLHTRLSCARRSITTALPIPFKSYDVSRPALSSGWSRRRSTAPLRLITMASGKVGYAAPARVSVTQP